MQFYERLLTKKGFRASHSRLTPEEANERFNMISEDVQLGIHSSKGRKRRRTTMSWQTHVTYWRREGKEKKISLEEA